MKRFTETGKWGDPWFRKMPPKMKLLWQYICDSCDAAGVILFDAEAASFAIGEEFTEDDIFGFGKRVRRLESGRVLIVNFIPFQYGELSEQCRPHKVVFDAIRKHKLQYPIGYPINGVSDTPQDKEKEKDKEGKGSAEGKTRPSGYALPACFESVDGFSEALAGWIEHRKKIKKPATGLAVQTLIDTLASRPLDAVAALRVCIFNGWQGFKWSWYDNHKDDTKLNGHTRSTTPVNPRVVGTANANMCQQYEGVGRVKGTGQNNGGSGH